MATGGVYGRHCKIRPPPARVVLNSVPQMAYGIYSIIPVAAVLHDWHVERCGIFHTVFFENPDGWKAAGLVFYFFHFPLPLCSHRRVSVRPPHSSTLFCFFPLSATLALELRQKKLRAFGSFFAYCRLRQKAKKQRDSSCVLKYRAYYFFFGSIKP